MPIIDPRADARRGARTPDARALGPYEAAYDVRRGYEAAPPAADASTADEPLLFAAFDRRRRRSA
jgi:hypothetical protein